MTWLEINSKAPDFTVKDQNERNITLSQYQGNWVALYFYPKAMTPGCTIQAQNTRDNLNKLKEHGITVLGISPDQPAALKRFEERDNLNFTLLSDPDHKIADTYKTWQEKNMYGKKFFGIVRATYIIDPQGTIRHIFKRAKTNTHSEDVINKIAELNQ